MRGIGAVLVDVAWEAALNLSAHLADWAAETRAFARTRVRSPQEAEADRRTVEEMVKELRRKSAPRPSWTLN
jgi:hypothetical protein